MTVCVSAGHSAWAVGLFVSFASKLAFCTTSAPPLMPIAVYNLCVLVCVWAGAGRVGVGGVALCYWTAKLACE